MLHGMINTYICLTLCCMSAAAFASQPDDNNGLNNPDRTTVLPAKNTGAFFSNTERPVNRMSLEEKARIIRVIQGKIDASREGSFSFAGYTFSRDSDAKVRVRVKGYTRAFLDNSGKVIALSKSRQQNARDRDMIDQLLRDLADKTE